MLKVKLLDMARCEETEYVPPAQLENNNSM